ncbi:MAG: hypothetical protein AAGF12_12755 [Myxococcota bacterium]
MTLAVVLGACGSGYATYVDRDTLGGTLMLRGPESAAREDAASAMAGHCQGAYTIVEETRSGDALELTYRCGVE